MLRTALVASASCLFALGLPIPSAAETFDVDPSAVDADDDDVGDGVCKATPPPHMGTWVCSLRAAIQEANSDPEEDEIEIPDGTYLLSVASTGADQDATGDLDIREDLTIRVKSMENAPGGVVIDAESLDDRVFDIHNNSVVTIEGVTIRGGSTTISAGGIRNEGTLILRSCAVEENAGDTAGAIESLQGSRLVMEECTVAGNDASSGAGGIRLDRADALLRQSTLSGNTTGGAAGALYNYSTQPGYAVILVNSTVSANDGPAILSSGSDARTELNNTTVASNFGTGLSGDTPNGEVYLQNSVLADNDGGDCAGDVLTQGYNLVESPGSCTFDIDGDTTEVDASLFALADNDGPTRTHLPRPGSPLIDEGNPANCTWFDLDDPNDPIDLAQDQRGEARPTDGLDGAPPCDIGAVEVVPEPGAAALGMAALGALGALARGRRART